MIRLVILGATGSIGTTALNAIRKDNPGIKVVGLSANKNKEKLLSLKEEFGAEALLTDDRIEECSLPSFLDSTKSDIVLNAIMGFDGLYATKCVLEKGIDLALSNKESVVSGASFIFKTAEKNSSKIIPVDSEHSAIYNLLKGKRAEKLVITASGGPFVDRNNLIGVTKEEALKHPTWKMGRKITIDSATLANKGLEVIEASYLFSTPGEKIEVVVHRQSIVHSMIRTQDGGVYAQLSPPDMTLPIMSAITKGDIEMEDVVKPLCFDNLTLTFEKPDKERFPLLDYAYKALDIGYSGGVIYNAADEVAVKAFLDGRIDFVEISEVVRCALEDNSLTSMPVYDYPTVYHLDRKTRSRSEEIIKEKQWRGC